MKQQKLEFINGGSITFKEGIDKEPFKGCATTIYMEGVNRMDFKCTINMDNAAFGEAPEFELVRLLDVITGRLKSGYTEGVLMDANGNKVGRWDITTP
jgi:hypothetical protein